MDFCRRRERSSIFKEPGGPGVRVDRRFIRGMPVTTNYNSLLAKVIAWGEDRPHAIRRLERALRRVSDRRNHHRPGFSAPDHSSERFIGGNRGYDLSGSF